MTGTGHAIVPLLAFVDDEFDDSLVVALGELANELARARSWLIAPPQVVDETDEFGVRTVGLVHQLYATYDERGALLDEAADRALLQEVQDIIAELERLSAAKGVDFGLELDGGSVGWVEQGSMTDDLRVGLLDSWATRFA